MGTCHRCARSFFAARGVTKYLQEGVRGVIIIDFSRVGLEGGQRKILRPFWPKLDWSKKIRGGGQIFFNCQLKKPKIWTLGGQKPFMRGWGSF